MHVQASEIDFSVQLCVYIFVHSPPILLRQMAAKMRHMLKSSSNPISHLVRRNYTTRRNVQRNFVPYRCSNHICVKHRGLIVGTELCKQNVGSEDEGI